MDSILIRVICHGTHSLLWRALELYFDTDLQCMYFHNSPQLYSPHSERTCSWKTSVSDLASEEKEHWQVHSYVRGGGGYFTLHPNWAMWLFYHDFWDAHIFDCTFLLFVSNYFLNFDSFFEDLECTFKEIHNHSPSYLPSFKKVHIFLKVPFPQDTCLWSSTLSLLFLYRPNAHTLTLKLTDSPIFIEPDTDLD